MPNNSTWVCIPCRFVSKGTTKCPNCHGDCKPFKRISFPKKSNDRAWKRIERGETKWNRRKARKRNNKDSFVKYDYVYEEVHSDVFCEHDYCKRPWMRPIRVPGSEKEFTNYNRTPDVDLGG